jgi:hypothetical protein
MLSVAHASPGRHARRVALLADVHGNAEAIEYAKRLAFSG